MVRTLKDLDVNSLGEGGGDHSSAYHKPIQPSSSSMNSHTAPGPTVPISFDNMVVCNIPGLPLADAALTMIERVCKEFEPIIKRRGYNVKSVSEMCCCNDGLDFDAASGKKKGGRKRKIMSHNVWGYNQTTFRGRSGKSHTIHLRLRHPSAHDKLLLYEDVAGTMAHELAHCEIGPHNDKFNKLMDDILEEHMMLQCKQSTGGSGPGSFVPFAGEGVALGGSKGSSNIGPNGLPGIKLGGDNSFTKWLSPGEAACMAAEARRRQQNLRLRGNHCCQPVTITIPEDDSEPIVEVLNADGGNKTGGKRRAPDGTRNRAKKAAVVSNPAVSGKKKQSQKKVRTAGNEAVIDLTEQENCFAGKDFASGTMTSASVPTDASTAAAKLDEWACQRCTFINQAMALACSMCSLEKQVA